MATLSNLVVKLKLDAGDFKSELDKAERSTRGFGSNLQTAGKVALGAGMAAGALAVGGVAAVMGETIPLAADFQSQLAILGIAAKDSGQTFDQLHDAALTVGGDTKLVGVSATGAADAMTGLYKAGLTTGEIFGDLQGYMSGTADLGGALRASIDLAAATNLDMVQASDLATVALSTFGGEMVTEAERAEFINKAMNNMVQTADASVAEVGDLALALKNVGPAAAGLGISFEDTNNALAILSTRGITGAEAGTALKSMLTNLQRPTAAVQTALDELGVSLFDAQGEFVGMPNLVGQLEGAFSGLTDEQKNMYAQTIAGTYGMSALNTLLAEGTGGWKEMEDATAGAAGIQEQAAAMANTFSGRMEALGGTVESLKIGIGEAFLPIAEKLVDWLASVVETHGPAIVDTVGDIVSKVMEVGGVFLEFFQGLLSGEDPIGDFANLFYRLASIFGATEEQASNLFEQVRKIGDTIMEILGPVIEWVQENVKLQDVLIALGAALAVVIIPILAGVISAVAPVIAVFLVVVAIVALVRKAWEENFLGIQDKTQAVLAFIRNLIDNVLTWIREFWADHGDQIITIAENAWETIKSTIETIVDIVKGIIELFSLATEGRWYEFGQKLREMADTAWNAIKDAISSAVDSIKEIVSNLITNIVDTFKNTDWGELGKSIIQGIANGIKNSVSIIIKAAKSAAKAAYEAALGFLKGGSPSRLFMELGQDTMLGFAIGLRNMDAAKIAMRDITKDLVNVNVQASAGSGQRLTVYGDLVLSGVQDTGSLLEQLQGL